MKVSAYHYRGLLYMLSLLIIHSCTPITAPSQQIQVPSEEPNSFSKMTEMTSPIPILITPALSQILTPTPRAKDSIAPNTQIPLHTGSPATVPIPTVGQYCSGKTVHLDIPDRDEDEIAPDEGWCGETSIQMALEYFGKELSQQAINLAGKPKQADLWEDDINVALDALGVKYVAWDEYRWDVNGFLTWIGEQLRAGYPVLLGVKIYPDQEPDWEVDHFVLVVGCDQDGIIINTNNAGEGQIHVSYSELTTNFVDSYSIINRQKYLFGRAIQGVY